MGGPVLPVAQCSQLFSGLLGQTAFSRQGGFAWRPRLLRLVYAAPVQRSSRRRPGVALATSSSSGGGSGAAGGKAAPRRQPAAQQPQQQPPQQQAQQQGQQQYLYEGRYGLPVVRQRLSYNELLRDVRLEQVSELRFFSFADTYSLEGPCLVVYKDGHVAQGYVPENDFRMHYAMETHGVMGVRMEATPTQSQLSPPKPLSESAQAFLLNVAPYLAVALVYAATQYARWLKGDAEDRDKIRRKAAEEKRRKAAEEAADQLWTDVEDMARAGYEVDAIVEKFTKAGLEEGEVREVVMRAQAEAEELYRRDVGVNKDAAQQLVELREFHARMQEQQAEGDPQAQAEQMLKLKTVKIQKAKDPAKQRAMKEARKKLKNVKLQYTDPQEAIFFDDVAGIGDAKVELQEVVDFFRQPERFRASGSRIPRGVLLCGPPGTGKTLLARAVAGEAGVSFLSLNASEFVEMFVGVGASRVRDLFATARSMAPAIIFIDEIDSVGRVRGGARGNDERDQTLNQMLSEMDGFDSDSQVIVMAATNRVDILDPALIRPGRFDRIIQVPLPDYNGRIEILKVHVGKRAHSGDIDYHELAFETTRNSGAQLANLVNMAATIASQAGRKEICNADLFKALEIDRLGPERPPFSEPARRRIAIMEAATAIACTLMPAIEPVVEVTIVPRENYPLGQTVVRANEQRELTQLFTRRYLEEQLLTTLAGRAAEELIYGPEEMSTMHMRRLVTARRIASKLVVSNAMSDNPVIGPRTVSHPQKSDEGRTILQVVTKFMPYEVHEAAEGEMERLMGGAYEAAKALVQRNRPLLDRLVSELLARNTVSGEELRELVRELGDPADVTARDAHAGAFL